MGSKISVQNMSDQGLNVGICTVGKGFEVKSFTVNANSAHDDQFPEAVWYDVKFIINGYEVWQIGVYGGSDKAFKVTYIDGVVYVNQV